MTKTNLYRNIMTIFLSLMLCNHAIRSIFYLNFIYIYFLGALTFFNFKNKKSPNNDKNEYN